MQHLPASISQLHWEVGFRTRPDKLNLHTLSLRMFWQKHPKLTQSRDYATQIKDTGVSQLQPASASNLTRWSRGPALFSIICTHEEQHDNTGIHANSRFWDQSTQMASWQPAYCWIIHSLHQAGKKSSMGPGYSAFFPLPVFALPNNCWQKCDFRNETNESHFLIFAQIN